MRTFRCPDHPLETRTFAIPEGDDAGREFYYACGRRVTGSDEVRPRSEMSEHDKARQLRRLIKCMKRQALLSDSEAISAIIAHRQGDGRYGGSEAVVHYGGGTTIIRDAIRHRGWWIHSILGRWED